jgi:hypothetical protein
MSTVATRYKQCHETCAFWGASQCLLLLLPNTHYDYYYYYYYYCYCHELCTFFFFWVDGVCYMKTLAVGHTAIITYYRLLLSRTLRLFCFFGVHGSLMHEISSCRPYCVEYTGSHPNSEVKRHRARLVLGWGTAWEHLRVLTAF